MHPPSLPLHKPAPLPTFSDLQVVGVGSVGVLIRVKGSGVPVPESKGYPIPLQLHALGGCVLPKAIDGRAGLQAAGELYVLVLHIDRSWVG